VTITIEEGNRRLLVLADFLEKLPAERFDYSEWCRGDVSCPTTACALGWCPSIPEFASKLELFHEHGEPHGPLGVRLVGSVYDGDNYDISLQTAEVFFALNELEAEFVFVPSMMLGNEQAPTQRASAAVVAAHIRRFVASRS
jgi:hypothetical protein